ncbi:hypothetical protein K438DRAFT_1582639, partial [Mycena galopus ATCC 62051]
RTTHCTGCVLKFGGRNGKPDGICPDCGYVACADCICHNCRGTCYCDDSNFGYKYCERGKSRYSTYGTQFHYGARSGKLYRGDNHPEKSLAKDHQVPASTWEEDPRVCGNCGETKLCLVPGYTCTSFLCQP